MRFNRLETEAWEYKESRNYAIDAGANLAHFMLTFPQKVKNIQANVEGIDAQARAVNLCYWRCSCAHGLWKNPPVPKSYLRKTGVVSVRDMLLSNLNERSQRLRRQLERDKTK